MLLFYPALTPNQGRTHTVSDVAENPCWTARDGRVILITELADDHLQAIFAMIRRRCRFNFEIFDEMAKRGLWAADRAVLSRCAFKALLSGAPTTRNGTVLE